MREASSTAPADRDDGLLRLGMALHDMIQKTQAARDRAAREEKLHPTDFGCIGFLYRTGRAVSPKEIISYMNLSSGSGTALLDRLESAGYVRRIPNPDDRRSVLIELNTGRAADAVERYRTIAETYREATEPLEDAQLVLLAEFLERMATLADRFPSPKT